MGKTLKEIAQELKAPGKKVQLIYAFNSVGKTRLSREFKELVSPSKVGEDDEEKPIKVLYYNAFTEDLFYWDNDLDEDVRRKLIIHPNTFTDWVFKEQGQEANIINLFQRYANEKLTPSFSEDFCEISFAIEAGNEGVVENIKISKGEESCLIWCVFFSLLELVVDTLNEPETANRDTPKFNNLEYVFIDDPVSSLDENHLIELAVDIAELIKGSQSEDLKFIITTHNPLFYNVLCNELSNTKKSFKNCLEKLDDGSYENRKINDSPFSYHLFLLSELENAIQSGNVKKYHFNFLRQILEKMATFLGYRKWGDLLAIIPDGSHKAYYNRIINLCSHGKHSGEETALLGDIDKKVLGYLVGQIKSIYHFNDKQNR